MFENKSLQLELFQILSHLPGLLKFNLGWIDIDACIANSINLFFNTFSPDMSSSTGYRLTVIVRMVSSIEASDRHRLLNGSILTQRSFHSVHLMCFNVLIDPLSRNIILDVCRRRYKHYCRTSFQTFHARFCQWSIHKSWQNWRNRNYIMRAKLNFVVLYTFTCFRILKSIELFNKLYQAVILKHRVQYLTQKCPFQGFMVSQWIQLWAFLCWKQWRIQGGGGRNRRPLHFDRLWPCWIKFAFERKSEKSNANWVLTNQNRALRICVWFYWLAFKRKCYATGPIKTFCILFCIRMLKYKAQIA